MRALPKLAVLPLAAAIAILADLEPRVTPQADGSAAVTVGIAAAEAGPAIRTSRRIARRTVRRTTAVAVAAVPPVVVPRAAPVVVRPVVPVAPVVAPVAVAPAVVAPVPLYALPPGCIRRGVYVYCGAVAYPRVVYAAAPIVPQTDHK